MARPVFVVHDQETIENYRRLERILRELYQVLGELLAYGAPVVPMPASAHRPPQPPPPSPPSESPAILQNVINLLRTLVGPTYPASHSPHAHSNNGGSGHHRRQRRNSSECDKSPSSSSLADWTAIGSELRAVAHSLTNQSKPSCQVASRSEADRHKDGGT